MERTIVDPPGVLYEQSGIHVGLRWRCYRWDRTRPHWERHGETLLVERLIYAAAILLSMASVAVLIIY